MKPVCSYQRTRFWRHFLTITIQRSGQMLRVVKEKVEFNTEEHSFVTSHSCINFVVMSQNYKYKEVSTY